MIRLGGPLSQTYDNPDSWVAAVRESGYRASYCPITIEADDTTIRMYDLMAKKADIVIAEVGAWSNPLSPDKATRQTALDTCKKSLALADNIGARCCVNIAGSHGAKWDGPHANDLTEETFGMLVETVREIIDAVKPMRSFYTLETMPWMYPDSPDSYLQLIKAIDRKSFAVHLDPVNLVNSPQRYFKNGELLAECFMRLGPYIKSCHAKDISLRENFTVHLDEVRPGLGNFDYRAYLRGLNQLDADIPLMLEHLPNEEEYKLAAEYIRTVAQQEGISV